MALFKRPLVSRLAIALLAPSCFATGVAAAGDLADVQRLLKAGQAAEALRRIEQQTPAAAGEVQWRFVKAVALTDLARPAEAVKIYTRLIEERPDLPEPRNNLAVLYAQQGQFDKARITFESALRTNQAYAAAYDNLGDVHARLATASYARALQVADAGSAAAPSLAQVRELGGSAPPVLVAQAPAPKPAAMPASPAATPAPPPAKPAASATAPAAKPAASAAPPATPPAPAPAPASRSDAQSAAQLREAVMRWSAAWSRKDMDAYFGAYQPSFNGGKSRNAWMTDRKTRILGKSQIAVTVSGLVMEIDGEKARVQFRQNYRSDKLNVDSNKTLHFVRDGGKWLIDKETAG